MADEKIKVDISSRFPIFIEANADAFGEIFANMADDDQLRVLGAMVEHMKSHKLQWDYLALKLEKDEHRELRDQLRYVLFPTPDPEIADPLFGTVSEETIAEMDAHFSRA